MAMEELAPAGAPTPVGVNFSAARSVAIALIAGALTHEQLSPEWLSDHCADVEELAARVRVRHDWELTLETLRGPVEAGVSTADVG